MKYDYLDQLHESYENILLLFSFVAKVFDIIPNNYQIVTVISIEIKLTYITHSLRKFNMYPIELIYITICISMIDLFSSAPAGATIFSFSSVLPN